MLSNAQLVDVRRHAGYPLVGDTNVGDQRDMAYSWVTPGIMQTLFHRLNSLSDTEEAVLVNNYINPINDLEKAILDAGTNLDTDIAGIWVRNKGEVSDRTKLFNQKRRDMCAFIGIKPGPSLGDGGIRIGRA
jgi:hypothetical protein